MRTLVIQTTIRPTARAVDYHGTLRGYWAAHAGVTVLASEFGTRLDDESRMSIRRKAPMIVTFNSGHGEGDDETDIEIRDATTGAVIESSFTCTDRDVVIRIRGVACETTEEYRTLIDIRDNPQSADVADELYAREGRI